MSPENSPEWEDAQRHADEARRGAPSAAQRLARMEEAAALYAVKDNPPE